MSMRKEYTFDRVVRLIIGAFILVGFFFLIDRLSSVLLPFLLGWLIAYFMHPMVNFIQYKMRVKSRVVSIICAFVVIFLFLFLFITLVGPEVVREVSRFGSLVSKYVSEIEHNGRILAFLHEHLSLFFKNQNIESWLSLENIQSVTEKVLPSFWSLLSKTWRFVVGLLVVFMIFLYVFFILKDYENISKGFMSLIPPKYKVFIEELLHDVQAGMNSYFRGQGLIAFIVGILFAIGFSIIGLPMGVVVGLLIGVLNLVPYLQIIGIVPVLMLALLKSVDQNENFWLILLGVGIVFVVVQVTQDLLLIPKIMSKAMGLNPAVILLSLSVWGSLLGLVGMIIALPLTTLLISYYRRFVINEGSLPEDSER